MKPTIPLLLMLKLLSVLTMLLAVGTAPAAPAPGKSQPLTSPDQVPDGLAKSDWASIRAAYEAERHAFQPVEGGWQARNPGQQWTTKFDRRGFLAQPHGANWQWGLELKGYGFPGAVRAIAGVPGVKAEGQRLSYDWDAAVQEWFVNDRRGLEHGFTVQARPEGAAEAPLQFDLAVRGTLTPHLTADALGVEFRDAAGATVLTYGGLKVWDADGKVLASRFAPADSQRSTPNDQPTLRLLVEERGARYPLTIDPIAQQAYLKASQVTAHDYFGRSVAISGDTVVVGAHNEDGSATGVDGTENELAPDAGAVYVFVRSGTTWRQQAYLKATQVTANDQFGFSVAIAGDTLVVGANLEDGSSTGVNGTVNELAPDAGAAYIFVRRTGGNGGRTWSQQAYLKASQVTANDQFGFSVAISGDTVVVGANLEDGSATGVNGVVNELAPDAGAAYVFVRSGTTWSQQAYLKASQVTAGDLFGTSVAVAGDTVVVGATLEDGSATGVNGSVDELASGAGAAYVFVRSGTTWSQQARLKASQARANDYFGRSVASSGDTVVVGAPEENGSATGVNGTLDERALAAGAGAAYVFVRNGTTWSQEAYLKPAAVGTRQGGDNFGQSVAVAGDTVVVGAAGEDSSTTGVNSTPNDALGINGGTGAAYVFVRSGVSWSQQAYLKADEIRAGDVFGTSVAVSGDTVVVGAYLQDGSATGVNGVNNNSATSAGAAYVFTGLGPVVVAPGVTGISPTSGSTAGGTSVTITGTGFTGATGVTIGGAAATSVTVVSATSITCTTPAGTAGPASVVVTTPGGANAANTLYTYVTPTPAPTVTVILPPNGTTAGGTAVTLVGSGFTGATGITVGGTPATDVTVINDTMLNATTPAHATGVVDITVTGLGGTGTGTGLYTYGAAPIPAGAAWTDRTSAGSRNWSSIAASADGSKLAAVVYGGDIYTSTDGGATWTDRSTAGNRNWIYIATSADGSKLAAVNNAGDIYTSTDGGATWTDRTSAGSRNWSSIATSADGSKLAAVVYGGDIYTSTDEGATWTDRTSAGNRNWSSIAASADGSQLAAVVYGGDIYTSTDEGATWTERTTAGSHDWQSIAASADGSQLAAVVYGGDIYTSTDGGATWTDRTSAGSRNWLSIATSADGSQLAAVVAGGDIYTSTDGGATWTDRTSAGSRNWLSIATSADGSHLAAVVYDGDIYTSSAQSPTVTAISPTSGSIVGSTSVTITGTGFTGATGVTFGGTTATSVSVVSDTSITCITPAGIAGTASVVVTTPGGDNAANTLYTYLVPPTITSVIGPTAGQYRAGQSLSFTVNFSAAVTVSTTGGTPTLPLTIGAASVNASYASGSPGTALIFTYTVQVGDTDTDGIASASPLVLNGGTIKDAGSLDATLTFAPPNTSSVLVDTTAPTISIGAPSVAATANANGPVTYTVTYADAAFNASTLANGNITLNTTGTAAGTVNVTGSGTTRTVTISSVTGNGTLGISIGAGTASDVAGNLAPAAGPSSTFIVDNTAPTISLSAPSASSTATGPITYTVTYADANFNGSTLGTGNITLNTSGTATGTVGVSGSGLTRTVTISGISGDGTLGISIAAGTATDTAGSLAPAAGPSATFSVMPPVPPTITVQPASQTVAAGGTVNLSVTATGTPTLTFQWFKNGLPLAGQTAASLAVADTTWPTAGVYTVRISNAAGLVLSRPANVVVSGAARVLAWGHNGNGQTSVPAGLGEVAAVAAGGNHTVVLRANGTVAGWGYAAQGQTTAPAGLGTAVALRDNGTVVAWGDNTYGQRAVPAGLSGVVAVAAGWNHTVALKGDGTAVAWGAGTTVGSSPHYGQSSVPGALNNVVAVTAGAFHTMAFKADGTTVAWGGDDDGQRSPPASLATTVALSAGGRHSVALGMTTPFITTQPASQVVAGGGTVSVTVVAGGPGPISYQWRKDGVPVAGATAATLSLGSATWASAGAYSVLVSTPLGRLLSRPANVVVSGAARVLAWGYNGNGQTNVPAGLGEVAAVAAGGNHTVVLRANGTVAGWGYAALGQTTAPAGLGTAVALSAGKYHNAALRADGTVVAWGYNVFGQTNVPAGLSNCVAVAAGWYHTVALRENGTVVAWGHNGVQQTNAPAGLSNVLAVAAGDYHTVALRDNGTVVAWGDNTYGQRAVPAGLSGVVAVAAGWNHTVALKSDGTVVAWGAGTTVGASPHYGQSIVPAGLNNVVGVSAGGFHTQARKADGTVVAWGAGTKVGSNPHYGQALPPTGLTNVVSLGAGGYHSMALGVVSSGPGPASFAGDRGLPPHSVRLRVGERVVQSPGVPNTAAAPAAGFPLILGVEVGKSYVIQSSADLVTWTTLARFRATAPTAEFRDPTAPTSGNRFYRVVVDSAGGAE